MSKKIVLFFLVLVAAICLSFYFLNYSSNQFLDENERSFSFHDSNTITKILLRKKSDSTVLLVNNKKWLLADNETITVQVPKINELLYVLQNLEVKCRVPSEIEDSIKQSLYKNGVEVLLYEGKTCNQHYFIGEDLTDSSGVYGIKKGAKTPFVLHVLGDKKLYAPIYTAEPRLWKNKTVFNLSEGKLTSFALSYPQDITASFSILIGDNELILKNSQGAVQSVNSSVLVDYLRGLQEVSAAKNIEKSIVNEVPFFKMEIEQQGNEKQILVGFRKKAQVGQTDFSGKLLRFDNEQFYLKKEGSVYLMNYFTFDGLLKNIQDFN